MSAVLDVNDLLAEWIDPATRVPSTRVVKPTVLVATPSRSVQNALSVALQSVGYDCQTAGDAYALADVLGRTDCGLVVLDARLPGFPPYQLCKTIRQGPGPMPGVVVLSARSGLWTRLRAKWAGACGVLRRPVKPNDAIRIARIHLPVGPA